MSTTAAEKQTFRIPGHMKVYLPLLVTLSCILFGCANHELRAQLQAVVVDDGISAAEADVIAQSYFRRFGPGCGGAAGVTDGGAFWVSQTAVGYAGVPTREPIRIDKRTGRVTWGSDGPTIKNPKKIL